LTNIIAAFPRFQTTIQAAYF